MRIAVSQPYFLPYPGYFRLMRGVDAFVVYDTVQFPRGGWVHRNQLFRDGGRPAWLTLPLAYAPLRTCIRDIAFHDRARELWSTRIRAFPACRAPQGDATALAGEIAAFHQDSPVEFICRTLRSAACILGIDAPFVMASSLGMPAPRDRLEGLVGICRRLGATEYVNAPGGRALYQAEGFARHGIALQFLPDYRGPAASILQRLQDEAAASVRREIDASLA